MWAASSVISDSSRSSGTSISDRVLCSSPTMVTSDLLTVPPSHCSNRLTTHSRNGVIQASEAAWPQCRGETVGDHQRGAAERRDRQRGLHARRCPVGQAPAGAKHTEYEATLAPEAEPPPALSTPPRSGPATRWAVTAASTLPERSKAGLSTPEPEADVDKLTDADLLARPLASSPSASERLDEYRGEAPDVVLWVETRASSSGAEHVDLDDIRNTRPPRIASPGSVHGRRRIIAGAEGTASPSLGG